MCTKIGGPYEVGGLKFKKTAEQWPYEVVREHSHEWAKTPRLGKNWNKTGPNYIISKRTGARVAQLSETAVTFFVGYAWDGSSGPAIDTRACMRASALHDVWCQGMKLKIYDDSYRNWIRGVSEYRSICREDGMSRRRAWLRSLGMSFYGLKKLWPS